MNELLQTALQTAIKRILPRSQKAEPSDGSATASICSLKRDWTLGKVVVFQIDSHSLQYCIAQRGITSTKVLDFGKIYRPRVGERLADHAAFLSDELVRLKKQHKLTNARIGLSISSSDIAVRTLTIPQMPQGEERRAIYFEGDKRIPFSLDDAYWSYRRCERISSGSGNDVTITLMALQKQALDDVLSFFHDNNIFFDFISLDIEALGLALGQMPEFSDSQPHGLLNIRPTRTDISLYSGTRLKFLHHGGFGSVALGQSLQFNSEAQQFMPQAFENFTEGLANVIQNALDYYGAQHSLDEIEAFYIYGDFTYSDQLIERLSEKFGVTFRQFPVEVFNSLSFAEAELNNVIPVALPVIAAATCPYMLSDFTPDFVHERNRSRMFMRHAIAASALVALGLGTAWSAQLWQGKIAERALADAKETVDRFESSPAYAGYRILKEELLRQESIINKLEKEGSDHYLALKELSALTPSSIRLDYLQYYPKGRGTSSTLSGMVISRSVAPEVILAEYTSRLEGSPVFTNVQIKSHNKSIEGSSRKITFSMTLTATL